MAPEQEHKLSKISALAECIIDIAKTLDKENLSLIQSATSIYNTAEQLKIDDLMTKNGLAMAKEVEESEDSNKIRGKVYFYNTDNSEAVKGWCLLDPYDYAKIMRFCK